ncbi:DUF4266 domain-containing protein [Thermochromatium tepidum]|uniref:DUF4266 domain-containing protein n=1 Tax=Thermochromatium tepidum ATCC 43061 TaxID=316276 RepID=A0A6I6EAB1_THETI|nr:DUF4266 domain-containing protein [Thermochromatium tepidum]QGU31869.1 DUF4266 domain-containing protein [Thermochromatium tepidum ATCC 43061]
MTTQYRFGPLMLLTTWLCGCATQVAPWERGRLARPEMALEPYPLEASLRQHVFFSKESVSGGYGVGGGGCGCN